MQFFKQPELFSGNIHIPPLQSVNTLHNLLRVLCSIAFTSALFETSLEIKTPNVYFRSSAASLSWASTLEETREKWKFIQSYLAFLFV